MELEIFWSLLAENKLQDIYSYYKLKAGLIIARKIIDAIIDKTDNLGKHPKIGAIEEFLSERPQEFRYLVSSNYKIIYYVNYDEQRIVIANVFDARQNPLKINETQS